MEKFFQAHLMPAGKSSTEWLGIMQDVVRETASFKIVRAGEVQVPQKFVDAGM